MAKFVNPYAMDGEIAKKILNKEQILGDTSRFLDYNNQQDYNVWDNLKIPIGIKNPTIYIIDYCERVDIQSIKSYVNKIYFRNYPMGGNAQKPLVNIEMISIDFFEKIKDNNNNKQKTFFRPVDSWVKISVGELYEDYGDNYTYFLRNLNDHFLYLQDCWVAGDKLPSEVIEENNLSRRHPYSIAYNIAHEVLHQLWTATVFYLFNDIRVLQEDDPLSPGQRTYPVHTNDMKGILDANVPNLLTDANSLGKYHPVIAKEGGKAEEIVPYMKWKIMDFFIEYYNGAYGKVK